MMIYSCKVALGQIYRYPIHTTLFLSPKNIFPVKSNVRKGHIHQSMLINPLPFPLQVQWAVRKEEKCTLREQIKYWRHPNLAQERINISANTQGARYKLIILKSQGTMIITRLTTSSESVHKYAFFLFSSTMILQMLNNNSSYILVTYCELRAKHNHLILKKKTRKLELRRVNWLKVI